MNDADKPSSLDLGYFARCYTLWLAEKQINGADTIDATYPTVTWRDFEFSVRNYRNRN
jgi:hypothetical protein